MYSRISIPRDGMLKDLKRPNKELVRAQQQPQTGLLARLVGKKSKP